MKFFKICFLPVLFAILVTKLFAEDNPVKYQIKEFHNSEGLNPGCLASTYFNGKAYLFSRKYSGFWNSPESKGGVIECGTLDIANSDGKLHKYSKFIRKVVDPLCKEDENTSGTKLCTCVYNGKIYLFYDYINLDNWSQRYICYKTSPDPENQGWAPAGGARVKSKDLPVCLSTGFGPSAKSPLLSVTVLNNKLYLFYTMSGESCIWMVVFDGREWTVPHLLLCGTENAIQAISAQSIVTTENKTIVGKDGKSKAEMIDVSIMAIAIKVNKSGTYKIHVVTSDESVNFGKQEHSLVNGINYPCYNLAKQLPVDGIDCSSSTDMHGIFGTMNICDMEGKNALWIFTDATIYPYDISNRRLLTGKSISEISGVTTKLSDDTAKTAIAIYTANKDKDLQMYITFMGMSPYYRGRPRTYDLHCETYKSDYFERVEYNDSVSTVGNPDAWTLIGVVEGIPPFSINGFTDKDILDFFPSSSVTFIHNKSKTSGSTSTYGETTAFGLNLIHPACGAGVSSTFTNALSNTYQVIKTKEVVNQIELKNAMGNKGTIGWLIVERPTFSVNEYVRHASNRKILGNVTYIYVSNLSLDFVEYQLKHPFEGMASVENSDNLTFWEKAPPHTEEDKRSQHVDSVTLSHMSDISSASGASMSSSISSTEESTVVMSSQRQFQLDLNAIFATFSQNFSITQERQQAFRFGTSFNVNGFLLPGEKSLIPNYITKITISPLLLKPDDESTEKPSWVPNQYKNSRPWLLTWKLLRVERVDTPPPFKQEYDSSGQTIDHQDSQSSQKGSLRSHQKENITVLPNYNKNNSLPREGPLVISNNQ